jgi:hypothetical protein
MQKTFAGIKPNCAVRNPIRQITTLLTAARIHPSQQRRLPEWLEQWSECRTNNQGEAAQQPPQQHEYAAALLACRRLSQRQRGNENIQPKVKTALR